MLPAVSTRPRTAVAAALVVLALTSGGCSSSESSSPDAAPTTGGSPAGDRSVPSTVVLGKVAGTIRKKNRKVFTHHRKQLLTRVGRAVDTWIDGGFVGVDYPRDSFPTAFAGFTTPAKRAANHQRRLMTNWHLRKRIDAVRVKKRKISVDVLAPRGRPAGVTAHVRLVFQTSGHAEKRVTVRGRLFLDPDPHGSWRIFGYDVSRGVTG